ncbi:2' O-ribose methyltransferase [Xylographa bjoerkii]|nr:2' O-ribose methyltransferase [Xylographa bjoerkii]
MLCRQSWLGVYRSSESTVSSYTTIRASSSSSKRWQTRAGNDQFSKEARVKGLKSRAAFKLLEINEKYKVFKAGQTVVDLGYAPGSWSQVAVDRTSPNGRVIGIDVIPAQPPKGVSTIQGNFLSHDVQEAVKDLLRESSKRRTMGHILGDRGHGQFVTDIRLEEVSLDQRQSEHEIKRSLEQSKSFGTKKKSEESEGRLVDIVLSDMSEPWEQTTGFWIKSLSNPYHRMMNTSGMNFRDHAGSMDLCNAALNFSYDTLRTGGHFVCKFYQGAEEKALETRLKALFAKVHREKPESSRSVGLSLSTKMWSNTDDSPRSRKKPISWRFAAGVTQGRKMYSTLLEQSKDRFIEGIQRAATRREL